MLGRLEGEGIKWWGAKRLQGKERLSDKKKKLQGEGLHIKEII